MHDPVAGGGAAPPGAAHAELGFVATYLRAVTWLSRVSGVVAAGLIALAVLVICEMVVERYILGHTTIWQIDVVTYSVVGATFIGSAYVLMTRGHVNVDVLPLHLSARPRYRMALVTIVAGLAFCVVLFVMSVW
jgi:TRAP-type C4-dicarboxylate transport system permease small subunit